MGAIRSKMVWRMTALLLFTGLIGCADQSVTSQEDTYVAADRIESNIDDTSAEERYVMFPEFSSSTLAGESMDASIFRDAEITMVNIWGTFCGPCIREMPDLEELYQELPEGCALVGVLTDVYGDKNLDAANRIVSETGVTYANIIPDEALYQFLAANITGVPTTLYVDTEGRILGGVVGTRSKEEYLEILKGLIETETVESLEEVGTSSSAA